MSRAHSPTFPSLHLRHNSFSNPSVALPTSQLILQPFRCFTYDTTHSPTLLLLHLRHSSFSKSSFASPTSQTLHLIHLASRPCILPQIHSTVTSVTFRAILKLYFFRRVMKKWWVDFYDARARCNDNFTCTGINNVPDGQEIYVEILSLFCYAIFFPDSTFLKRMHVHALNRQRYTNCI